ncbi:oxidoreductase [Amniculicola lignicola CBS 123094]|uniref:Oxidoreductase n=1 Tax=Amniculicola lignicola CBS 123094 TaxID=1392246 RepID=A0A6A5W3P8_9PLEO|nr:oxidoreductase [Amniculicola lignicola CBS 123094]
MLSDYLRLFSKVFTIVIPYALTLLRQKISATVHSYTYHRVPTSQVKTVVVVGGSFSGIQVVKRLSETLPTGYRVLLLEKNSHLNYLFCFPRFSVVGGKGYEKYAFIPYDGLAKKAPRGIFERKQGEVQSVGRREIVLVSGEKIPFEYLILATGTSSSLPSKVLSTNSKGGMTELQGIQERIARAKRIAVVGGGAVGVELAGDIKDHYGGEKYVTLFHSRGQLLNLFGKRLQEHTMEAFGALGVTVVLNERPKLVQEDGEWRIEDKKGEVFDLVIPCTGQRPNSGLLAKLSPSSISQDTSRILVKPTLQITDPALQHIFAIGDVAETGGPRMARAAFVQGEIVVENLLALIEGKTELKTYKPDFDFEGAIKLTLGKTKTAIYSMDNSGRELLVAMKGKEDMGVKSQWRFFGADVKMMEAGDEKTRVVG